jgi:putative ABC transport system permease protein
MNGLLMDFRLALRALRKTPGATAVAALALALGIGVNTSSFIWVSALVLHPLPYPHLERIMTVWETVPKLRAERDAVAPANYVDWRKQNGVFERLAAYRPWDANLTGAGEPERIQACLVAADFFALLGMQPALGRSFSLADEEPSGGAAVIVSHGFWQRRLGSNPDAVGRTISLDNRDYTVAGVMPADFDYPLATELWAPLAMTPQEKDQRASRTLLVLGRLRPGVTVAEARGAMGILAGRLERAYSESNQSRTVAVVPLRELANPVTDRFVLTLAGSAGFVLLLACANVASLMLARATGRQRQFAVESALGASRFRVARLLVVESALIALMGGVLGIWLAGWNLDFTKSRVPSEVLRFVAGMRSMHIDAGVAAFTLACSVLAAVLCGLPAALLALRRNASGDLAEALKEGGRSPSSGPARSRARSTLVAVEVALALVLLVGAGLMVETFRGLLSANPGFNPKNLLTMRVALPEQSYRVSSGFVAGNDWIALPERPFSESAEAASFYRRTLTALGALPGVRFAAAYADLAGPEGFSIEGRPEPRPGEMRPGIRAVSSRYFEAMQLPIQQGRGIADQDGAESPRVVVLAESVARNYWPDYPRNASPLGNRIKLGGADSPWLTVAGVCGDVKNWFSGEPMPFVYIPSVQAPRPGMTLLLRASGDPVALAPSARAAIRAVDRDAPVYEVESMEQNIAWQTSGVGGAALSMEIYAAIALLLAVTGIYALTSYSAAQRTHEIGIRMALGARGGDVLKMVVGQSLRISGAGLAIGLPAALILAKIMSSVLSGVVPMDLRAVAAFTVLLGSSALLAAYIPARRAARLDPMAALHHE